MPKATRLASLAALLLGCSVLSANAGWFSSDSSPKSATPATVKDDKAGAPPAATSLEDSIRQAQMLRLDGKYDEAINHLSQVMLVAADDSRVISEYGKTLVAMGRAEEGLKFLTRAQQMQPNDWSVYSALGVAYDESGDQRNAQLNYEHALTLKPGEPSVLNNYALSRMLAKDPAMARKLADRAEIANAAAKDAQIARNITMIRSLAPEQAPAMAVNTPAPSPVPHSSVAMTAPVALMPARAQLAPVNRPAPTAMASSAPRTLNANPVSVAQLQNPTVHAPAAPDNRVVMERVPVDPLAGPVATHAPRSLKPKAVAKADAPETTTAKTDAPVPAKTAKADDSDTKAAAKPASTKPAPAALAKADAAKPTPKVLPTAPVKAAAAKPAVKSADAKAVPASAKTKDAIPSLRMSANAY
jgi:Flp pilus assembly protein TadD